MLEYVLEGLFHIAKAMRCCILRKKSSSGRWLST
jgi:hypothetical protein